jgi:hypothetical protein
MVTTAAVTCTGPPSNTIARGGTASISCVFKNTGLGLSLAIATLGLNDIRVASALQAGWSFTVSVNGGTPTPAISGVVSLLGLNLALNPANATQTITIAVTAPCTALVGTTNSINVTSKISLEVLGLGLISNEGPWASVPLTVVNKAAPDVTLANASLGARTYSATNQTSTGTMALGISNPSGCAGWTTAISAADFSYSGPNHGSAIPIANLTITNASLGVSALPLATSSQTLVSNGVAGTSFNYALDLALTIPGGSRVGVYATTVTVSTSSGP